MVKIRSYTLLSHQGPYLEINEDFAEIDLKGRIFGIYDGMGGSGIGDAVVRKCSEVIKEFFARVNFDPDSTMPYNYNPHYLLESNALMNAIKHIHTILIEENSSKTINFRAAVSSLVGVLSGDILAYCSCGTCLGLIIRDGEISPINIPESLSGMKNNSILSNFKNYPSSALGLFPQVNIDVREIRIKNDDCLCLMTDGIYGRFSHLEIKDILIDVSKTLRTRAQYLIKKANDRGNLDNQSIIIVQF